MTSAVFLAAVSLALAGQPRVVAPQPRLPVIRPRVEILRPEILRRLPKLETVMVYRTAPDDRWLAEGLPRAFDFFGVPVELRRDQADPAVRYAEAGDRYGEVYDASGATFCGDMGRLWPIPNLDEALAIDQGAFGRQRLLATARDFVRTVGALPDTRVQTLLLPDRLVFQRKGGETKAVTVSAAVAFRPVREGIPLAGPGGKVKVYFDSNGKIAGLLRAVRAVKPFKKMAVVPVERVVAEIRRQPIRRLRLAGVKAVEIARIRMVYYEDVPNRDQKYLQPAYEVSGVARGAVGGQQFSVPYLEYMPALTSPPEPLFMPGRSFAAEPRPSRMRPPERAPRDE